MSSKKIIGATLAISGVAAIIYAFAMKKGEYGSKEYREKQPKGVKILLAGMAVASIGVLLYRGTLANVKENNNVKN